jgi:hypothetical protein
MGKSSTGDLIVDIAGNISGTNLGDASGPGVVPDSRNTTLSLTVPPHGVPPYSGSLSPQRGPRLSNLSLERFRISVKYQGRPAAADIAFCVAAYANGMTDDRIECALEDDYLSRDSSPSKRAAYIRRTIEKARRWAER